MRPARRGTRCTRPLAWLVIIALLPAACERNQVVLQGDDGVSELRYRCDRVRSRLVSREEVQVVEDYTLRLARAVAASGDTAELRRLMGHYEAQHWPELERTAVRQACASGALARPVLAFPSPKAAAPAFTLRTLHDSVPVSLAEYRGRLVVVDFWATWCQPCIRQLPELAATARQHPGRLVVLAILHRDSPAAARAWLAGASTDPVVHLIDPDRQAARDYRVFGLPTTFILDEQGRVLASPLHPRRRMRLAELEPYLRSEKPNESE